MSVNQDETHPQLQGCLHMHHLQLTANASTFGVENMQWYDQGLKQFESNKVNQRLNNSMDSGKNLDILHGTSGRIEGDREEIETLWQRMKWTDGMVKLLITAVAYLGDYVNLSPQNKNQKRGKWRAISYVMMQRGYLVSSQQCEDKFNDLNKKYRRLNEILGEGTACDVVQNPSVMDSMNLSDETAKEIIKILSSKQLFYREMCSYHNRNRLFLPHDEELEQSVRLALKDKDENMSQELKLSTKGVREGEDRGVILPENGLNCNDRVNSNCLSTLVGVGEKLPNERWTTFRLQKLEGQKFKLEEQRLKLEKKRLKWCRYSQHEDWILEKMSLENKLMKLQNQRFAFELESHKQGRKL